MKLFSRKEPEQPQEPEEYQLEKWIWTTDDFEQMGWHDNHIHGMGFSTKDDIVTNEFFLDIDYIWKWVHPPKRSKDRRFSFWISPATLVFTQSLNLKMDLDYSGQGMFRIADIRRSDYSEGGIGSNGTVWQPQWKWVIESHDGIIELLSSGYTQYIRKEPHLIDSQSLNLEERGGICFTRGRTDIEQESTP